MGSDINKALEDLLEELKKNGQEEAPRLPTGNNYDWTADWLGIDAPIKHKNRCECGQTDDFGIKHSDYCPLYRP